MHVRLVIKSLEVEGGGAERVLVDVANGLVARGHQVSVVTFDRDGAPAFYKLDPRVTRVGVAIGLPGQPTRFFRYLGGLWRLRRTVTVGSPDVVVVFMHSTYVPLALATLGAGVRMVASEHVGLAHFLGRPLQRWLVRATDQCFLGKTVPTARLREEFPPEDRRKISVLANPVDLAQFADASNSNEEKPPVLLCVGRFMEEKDHATLLEAFARLAREFPDWTLRLVGDGVLRVELEAMVARLALTGRVEMPGVSADVAAEYARAAVVVVPSRHEAFGLVVVESLAAARPVVGFAEALGPLEIAKDGVNARLVAGSGHRVRDLTVGLRELMQDEGLRRRLGQAGPASVQRFARDAVVDQWESFFLSCAGRA